MALTVEITGGKNIEQGAQITLTATVTDADGNTPPGTLQYAWSASRGRFIGATDEASAVYHADFTDTEAVDVTITCNVTRPANATPTSSGPSLTALEEIGVTGILVNMFMTELGAVATNTNNVLYNNSTGTLDAGSDQRLASNINIFQLRWDNTVNNFVLNNNEGGHIGNFFIGNSNQSVYLIFEDGTYVELTPTDFSNGTSRGNTWARWQVTGASILALLNALSATSDLVVGVADAGSIGWSADSGSDTETFTAAVPIPRAIDAVATQNIMVNTDWMLTVNITGGPKGVKLLGDLEGISYDWNAATGQMKIKGRFGGQKQGKQLRIEAAYAVLTEPLVREFEYNVVPVAPIIVDPGTLTFYRGINYDDSPIKIEIRNHSQQTNIYGLQIGLNQQRVEGGQEIIGKIPEDAEFTTKSGTLRIEASNEGGMHSLPSVPFEISVRKFFIVGSGPGATSPIKIGQFDYLSEDSQTVRTAPAIDAEKNFSVSGAIRGQGATYVSDGIIAIIWDDTSSGFISYFNILGDSGTLTETRRIALPQNVFGNALAYIGDNKFVILRGSIALGFNSRLRVIEVDLNNNTATVEKTLNEPGNIGIQNSIGYIGKDNDKDIVIVGDFSGTNKHLSLVDITTPADNDNYALGDSWNVPTILGVNWNKIDGLCYIGENKIGVVNTATRDFCIFDISATGSGVQNATLDKFFNIPTAFLSAFGVAVIS